MSIGHVPNRSCLGILACIVSLLSGCLVPEPVLPPDPELPPTPLETFMIEHGSGATATLDDPDFGQQIRITMLEQFTSAFGEPCKRASVLSELREAEMIVICQKEHGRWKMAPRIWGQGIQQR